MKKNDTPRKASAASASSARNHASQDKAPSDVFSPTDCTQIAAALEAARMSTQHVDDLEQNRKSLDPGEKDRVVRDPVPVPQAETIPFDSPMAGLGSSEKPSEGDGIASPAEHSKLSETLSKTESPSSKICKDAPGKTLSSDAIASAGSGNSPGCGNSPGARCKLCNSSKIIRR